MVVCGTCTLVHGPRSCGVNCSYSARTLSMGACTLCARDRLLRLTSDEFKQVFEVNTFGGFYFARALARSWIAAKATKGKQILFVSSISGLIVNTPQRQAAYNASKGAVTMLSKVGLSPFTSIIFADGV